MDEVALLRGGAAERRRALPAARPRTAGAPISGGSRSPSGSLRGCVGGENASISAVLPRRHASPVGRRGAGRRRRRSSPRRVTRSELLRIGGSLHEHRERLEDTLRDPGGRERLRPAAASAAAGCARRSRASAGLILNAGMSSSTTTTMPDQEDHERPPRDHRRPPRSRSPDSASSVREQPLRHHADAVDLRPKDAQHAQA